MPALGLAFDMPNLARHYRQIALERRYRDGQALVDWLELRPGERVLEVGCGQGELTAYIADGVRARGWVTGMDPSPVQVAIAANRNQAGVDFRVGDCSDLGRFQEGLFDAIVFNASLRACPHLCRIFSACWRLLKAGGRLGIHTDSGDHPSRFQRARHAVLARCPFEDVNEAAAAAPAAIRLRDLNAALRAAGFAPPRVDLRPRHTVYASADALIYAALASEANTSTRISTYVEHLPLSLQAAAHRAICAEIAIDQGACGVREEGARILAIAVK